MGTLYLSLLSNKSVVRKLWIRKNKSWALVVIESLLSAFLFVNGKLRWSSRSLYLSV